MSIMGLDKAKAWARAIKRDVLALWIAGQDPRTPLIAKLVAGAVAAYALSPIDLIPDFIPILGYLDDVILVPLGILWAVRLIPPALMAEFRARAQSRAEAPANRLAAIAIVGAWISVAAAILWWLLAR